MILIVTEENRSLHERELTAMHRQRKAVFVDRLQWPLAAPGGLEIDAYDRPDSIYLLSEEPRTGMILGSARLLPTVQRHLMSDLFADLCEVSVPRGPTIWEASRFCVNPSLTMRQDRHDQLWQIIAGILEVGLLFGLDQVTFVAARALLPLTLDAGWDVRVLGRSRPDGDDEITAVAAEITPDGLKTVRDRHGIPGPVTRFRMMPDRAVA
ncbi:acyl-homoserine-lactone synthase [Govanella unica]|uniref:Acyl-homoserine-lactone synthase n=1 Tax=Govanella unica TaxID=2975056 RepID=A0A9X3TXB7_9PROT|nr:acyl-homoserine-lactone synthase [Govania unica]MDA5193686.1 GNAT family N-acetyltransferase [Govania unica]